MDLNHNSFIVARSTIQEADQYGYSVDTSITDRNILHLSTDEIYNQIIYFGIDELQITNVLLRGLDGIEVDFRKGFTQTESHLLFSFEFIESDVHKCYRFEFITNEGIFYSNKIAVHDCHERTSLVTYRHSSNHYCLPYEVIPENFHQQIRLPIYYEKTKTEEDSEERNYYSNAKGQYLIGTTRVQRRFIEIWKSWAGDFINIRLSILSDTDCIYINGTRRISRPYVYDEIDTPDYLSESDWETQCRPSETIETDSLVDIGGFLQRPHYSDLHYSDLHYSTEEP